MDVTLDDTLNKQWKNDKTGFGFRMLQKMGWSEDKGLGKNETGMVSHVKVKAREQGLGLGLDGIDVAGNKGWSETTTSFNAVLDLLKNNYSGKEKGKEKGKKDEKKAKKDKKMKKEGKRKERDEDENDKDNGEEGDTVSSNKKSKVIPMISVGMK